MPRARPVHSCSRGFAWMRLGDVGFILVLVGSIRRAYMSSGLFGFAWVYSGARRVRRGYSGSRGFTGAHLMFVEYVRVNSLGRSSGSFG